MSTTRIPVLMVSINPRLLERAREQAEHFGAHRCLVKPFDLGDLLKAMGEMIGQAQGICPCVLCYHDAAAL